MIISVWWTWNKSKIILSYFAVCPQTVFTLKILKQQPWTFTKQARREGEVGKLSYPRPRDVSGPRRRSKI